PGCNTWNVNIAIATAAAAENAGTSLRKLNQAIKPRFCDLPARTARTTLRAKNGEGVGPFERPSKSQSGGSSSRFMPINSTEKFNQSFGRSSLHKCNPTHYLVVIHRLCANRVLRHHR